MSSVTEQARQMMELFQGSDLAFGRSELTGKISQSGKNETRSWTEKRAVTLRDWEMHLEGTASIGIPPINSKSMVRFGAIDVDTYRGLSLEDLARDITRSNLPLVLCRSKSGGPHIYLFVDDWVPAELMVEKLDLIAGVLGFGAAEIFPKQVTITTGDGHADFGNWINMPYFKGDDSLRTGFDRDGNIISGVNDFISFVLSRTVDRDALEQISADQGAEDTFFPEGPPCLNAIISQKRAVEGTRNVLMCNVALYCQKAFPDSWEHKLDEYNRLLDPPLPGRELETIKKSYGRREYRYMCSKSPLCDFCNSKLCKSREHGIEGESLLPNNRSLSVINTEPPIWYLDVSDGESGAKRISLTTEELQNPRLFQKRCMEVMRIMPPVPKASEWTETIRGLLKYCTEITLPPEMSKEGQFIEVFEQFIAERKTDESPEVLLRGLVYSAPTAYWFRWRDLKSYLKFEDFDLMKQNEIFATLKSIGAEKNQERIAGSNVNIFKLSKADLTVQEPGKLHVQPPTTPF